MVAVIGAVAAAEAVLAVVLGAALAAGVCAVALGGLWLALLKLVGPLAVTLPWQPVTVVTAVCLVTTVAAAVLPALPGDGPAYGSGGRFAGRNPDDRTPPDTGSYGYDRARGPL